MQKPKNTKKNGLLTVVFIVIAALSVWAVIANSRDFTLNGFVSFVTSASLPYVLLAALSMLCVILFEGLAVLHVSKCFGYKRSLTKGLTYSAADIYFSAITPSATGGQPASAYFMMLDGIPGTTVTVTLLFNLMAYTLSIIVIAVFALILRPSVFFEFGTLSKILIGIGSVLQIGLAIMFLLLSKKSGWVRTFAGMFLRLGHKLHLVRDVKAKEEKLEKTVEDYRKCAEIVSTHKNLVLPTFAFNMLQRIAFIMVTVFVYLASGGVWSKAADVFTTQSLVILGSNSIPIPGSVGVSDYMLIDGFKSIQGVSATDLELFSRGLSFYLCVILCGIFTLARYLYYKRRDTK